MEEGDFHYQIRLYKKGEIEIFQNVLSHRIFDPKCPNIEIRRESTLGAVTVSTRYLPPIYNIDIVDEPHYTRKTGPGYPKVVIH